MDPVTQARQMMCETPCERCQANFGADGELRKNYVCWADEKCPFETHKPCKKGQLKSPVVTTGPFTKRGDLSDKAEVSRERVADIGRKVPRYDTEPVPVPPYHGSLMPEDFQYGAEGPLIPMGHAVLGTTPNDARYDELRSILNDAYCFAAEGKGEERHGKGGLSWVDQRHATIAKEIGTGFPIGQAVKKAYESQGLDEEAAKRELLGAITYLASAIHAINKGYRK